MESKGIVNKVIPFSNVDGPGNRLAIFFQQCNIHCIYCHNAETINKCINCMECIKVCPVKAITNTNGSVSYNEDLCVSCDSCIKVCKHNSSPKTHEYSVDELFNIVQDYKPFIRGITVSGGEPTLQSEFIEQLFKRVKQLDLSCFVDTNAFFDKEQIKGLIDATDKFMVDIKSVGRLQNLCDTGYTNNLENLEYLLSIGKVHEVRTVVVVNYLDIIDTITQVANVLKSYKDVKYKLIKVHSQGLPEEAAQLVKQNTPSNDFMEDLRGLLINKGLTNIEII